MALTDNIQAYYKFDTDSSDSVGTNDGTDTSMSYANAGIIDNSATFNGSSSRISFSPITSLTTSFTVNFWINRTGTVGTVQVPIQLGRQTNFIWFYFTTGNNFRLVEDNIADYASSITISTSGWNMITVVKSTDTGTNLTYYLNGAAAGTASIGSVSTPANNAYFGSYSVNNSTFLYYFNGRLDEVGIWDRALSSTEITELYNSGAGLTYPFSTTAIKTVNGLAKASVKTVNGLAIASVKNFNGLA